MQPSNLGLDPANALWSSNSPSANPFFNGSSTANSNTDSTLNTSFYSTRSFGEVMGSPKADGPTLCTSTEATPANGYPTNDAFMGVSSPQPGGLPMWKWNNMDPGGKK